MVDAASVTAADKAKLAGFGASDKWAKNSIKREAFVTTSLHEEGSRGCQKTLEEIRKGWKRYDKTGMLLQAARNART